MWDWWRLALHATPVNSKAETRSGSRETTVLGEGEEGRRPEAAPPTSTTIPPYGITSPEGQHPATRALARTGTGAPCTNLPAPSARRTGRCDCSPISKPSNAQRHNEP